MGRKRGVIHAREIDMIAWKAKKKKKKNQEHPTQGHKLLSQYGTHSIAQQYGLFDITGHYLVISGPNNAVNVGEIGHICRHGNVVAAEGQLSQVDPRAK